MFYVHFLNNVLQISAEFIALYKSEHACYLDNIPLKSGMLIYICVYKLLFLKLLLIKLYMT